MMFSQPGSQWAPAKTAAANDATRYWPSTPMLNRFILNPMATATAERYRTVASLMIATICLRQRRLQQHLPDREDGVAGGEQDQRR